MTAAQASQPPKAKKIRKDKPVLEEVPVDHPANSKFARALGSVDFQTREKGLHALKSWLVRKNDIKEADMMKIWKGLFYCFWHSDKAPVQAELAERLAAMLTQLSEESAYLYFAAFMATVRREWFGIDRLRLDKFLMLVRKFVNKMLACLKAAKWRAALVQRYAAYLQHHVIQPADALHAAGLAYHCGDVLLDELRAVADGRPVPGEALGPLLAPFNAALQSGEQVVLHRIGDGLFDSLLSELGKPTDDSPYLQQLDTAGLAAQLFELGAAPNTKARNRQVLYNLSGALERLQRKRQRIDTGAQAGPSTSAKAAGKPRKQPKKPQAEAAAVTDAAPASTSANGEAVATADGAPARKGKRKAAAAAAEASGEQPQATEDGTGVGIEAPPAGKQDGLGRKKALKKKKQQAAEAAAAGATAPGVEEAEARPDAAAVAVAEAPAAAAAAAKTPKHATTNGSSPREPTSGQKAALRAALAKVGQLMEEKPAKAAKQAKQPTEAPQPASGQAAAAAPAAVAAAADAKPSVLGKRTGPGSGAKAGSQVPPASEQPKEQEADEAPAGNKTPVQARPGPARKQAVTTAKKGRVVINLKKNLYFEHGGPVPAPDIRTPPPARAKGGILKTAKTCPPKVAGSSAQQLRAAAAQQQQNGAGSSNQNARVLPKNMRRASAALFF